ncbi:hypothetical protein U9M48_027656 [Paspalum notatum var. saurae]|uniref:Uncharacterized protein n=1 Tax=Paspalum notatum var. saurae TaxID=547442 RepID=A0AAQ3WZT0_PASNO
MSSLDRNRRASGRPAGNIGHLGSRCSYFDMFTNVKIELSNDETSWRKQGGGRWPARPVCGSLALCRWHVYRSCVTSLGSIGQLASGAASKGKKKTGRQAKLLQKYSTAVTVKKVNMQIKMILCDLMFAR